MYRLCFNHHAAHADLADRADSMCSRRCVSDASRLPRGMPVTKLTTSATCSIRVYTHITHIEVTTSHMQERPGQVYMQTSEQNAYPQYTHERDISMSIYAD